MAVWVSLALVIIPLVFGPGGAVIGLLDFFNTLGRTGKGDPEALAEYISLSLIKTAGGVVVSLIAGLPLLIISLVMLLRLKP